MAAATAVFPSHSCGTRRSQASEATGACALTGAYLEIMATIRDVEQGAVSGLEHVVRPLLRLMQLISGLETTFITQIDWSKQQQEVLFALNTAELQVEEASVTPWSESMCRLIFLTGEPANSAVQQDFPASVGATNLALQTFVAVPILEGDRTIGTVCGASRQKVEVDSRTVEAMRLVSEAMAFQLATEQAAAVDRRRAENSAVEAALEREVSAGYAGLAAAMRDLALTDDLTGLPNRRAFGAVWEEELSRACRQHHPIALVAVDIDEFKLVNDAHGHNAGDEVLRTLAATLREFTRVPAISARLGGDEFVFAMPRADGGQALALAHRILERFGVRTQELGIPCTVSIGVAWSGDTPPQDLVAAADRALCVAKQGGRNRVETWVGTVSPRTS